MIHSLSHLLHPELIENLKQAIRLGRFPGITFKQAMEFVLTDGVLPESDLPVQSFLDLEDWMRAQAGPAAVQGVELSYSATELKNKTGEILEKVLSGHVVRLHRHGRIIAEMRRA
jgi:hypothetical protein